MDIIPGKYVSQVTGKEYDKEVYINHGYGGFKGRFMDLPTDEYPYLIVDDPKKEAGVILSEKYGDIIKETNRCPFQSTEKEDIFCVFYRIE